MRWLWSVSTQIWPTMEREATALDAEMSDPEALKKHVKKLSAQAIERKMQLHDLAEDLPIGWETIPAVAAEAYEAYRNLTEARAKLAETGDARG